MMYQYSLPIAAASRAKLSNPEIPAVSTNDAKVILTSYLFIWVHMLTITHPLNTLFVCADKFGVSVFVRLVFRFQKCLAVSDRSL